MMWFLFNVYLLAKIFSILNFCDFKCCTYWIKIFTGNRHVQYFDNKTSSLYCTLEACFSPWVHKRESSMRLRKSLVSNYKRFLLLQWLTKDVFKCDGFKKSVKVTKRDSNNVFCDLSEISVAVQVIVISMVVGFATIYASSAYHH